VKECRHCEPQIESLAAHGWSDRPGEVVNDGVNITFVRLVYRGTACGSAEFWSAEVELSVWVSADDPSSAVNCVMMHGAQQDEVDRPGCASFAVFVNVVSVQGATMVAAGESAGLVAFAECATLRLCRNARVARLNSAAVGDSLVDQRAIGIARGWSVPLVVRGDDGVSVQRKSVCVRG
jgi:hypothetical protein